MSKETNEAVYGAAQHGTSGSADTYYGIREAASTADRTTAERAVYANAGSGTAWFAAAEKAASLDHAGTVTPTGRDGSRAGFALRSD
ncbi:hypothetical protein [Haloparvum sedimenti]|uniref:hypothetical protein n=1 Tax=Haloparvum sedimenti TaxID=1678448 RepID=UPI00071E6DA9|nr:hypothetical protein [Haloparvum sedimenti]